MTAAVEMENHSENVLRRIAHFCSKGATAVSTLRDINGSIRLMDKLSNSLECIEQLEADL